MDDYTYRDLASPVPTWTKTYPLVHIHEACRLLKIDPALAIAIIRVESAGVTYRSRYEPAFRNTFYISKYSDILGISFATEEIAQKTSHGLMQVMGAVAREMGYADYLTRLYEPALGCYWGCYKLKILLDKYQDLWKAVASYNAGSVNLDGSPKNLPYVNKVKRYYHDMRKLPLRLVT